MERQDYRGRGERDDDKERDTRSDRDGSDYAYGNYPESGFGPQGGRYRGYDSSRSSRDSMERRQRYGAQHPDHRSDDRNRDRGDYASYGFGERYQGDYDRGRSQRARDARDRSNEAWFAGGYADLYGLPGIMPYAAADFGRSTYRRDADPRSGRHHGGRHHERGFLERAGDEFLSWFGDEDAQRRRERDHRGRGPSDYIRSDERIRDDVNDRLTEDSWVDASAISVAVSDGEVTLGGRVDSKIAKRRAEDLADDVTGVKHVQNNLRVDTSFVPQGS